MTIFSYQFKTLRADKEELESINKSDRTRMCQNADLFTLSDAPGEVATDFYVPLGLINSHSATTRQALRAFRR
ncbi:hypothetical protein K3495_g5730 [Podosphaera aphanis]|nr:hypothetical protein K3495_g5730 [Podosphaera aphanis]